MSDRKTPRCERSDTRNDLTLQYLLFAGKVTGLEQLLLCGKLDRSRGTNGGVRKEGEGVTETNRRRGGAIEP